jgi:hypothetical protein
MPATAFAQKSTPISVDSLRIEILYRRALEDSTLKFEYLKPAYHQLQKAYTQQRQAADALRGELRFERLQSNIRQRDGELRLSQTKQRMKRRWRRIGRAEGAIAAGLVAFLICR